MLSTQKRLLRLSRLWVGAPLLLTLLTACDKLGIHPLAETPSAGENALADQEIWNTVWMGTNRVGYTQLSIKTVQREGDAEPRVLVEGEQHLLAKREGQTTDQLTTFRSVETLAGRMLEYESETKSGTAPVQAKAVATGGRLQVTVTVMAKTTKQSIPWSDECGGPEAHTLSLLRQPMKPGEKREVLSWTPGVEQLATVALEAKSWEPIPGATPPEKALRIDAIIAFGGVTAMKGSLWCDRAGNILRQRADAMNVEYVRTTKEEATKTQDVGNVDLIADLCVPLKAPMAKGQDSLRVVYRVESSAADPAKLLAVGPTQQVESIDPQTARVTVTAVRPGHAGARSPVPIAEMRESSVLIQCDDPQIIKLAKQATEGTKDDWQAAKALELFVKKYITKKDYATGFATAAEVAKSRAGDCTEHSVLLAAMARACRIPARVAVGLVYAKEKQAFFFHMWDEFYIDGHWIPMDATLGRGGIGAAHLKMADMALKSPADFVQFMPGIALAGKMKITVESEE